MERVELKTMTKEEAISKVVDFFKVAKSPNVIPSTTQFEFGYGGFLMFENYKEGDYHKVEEHAFFPLSETRRMEPLTINDRIDFLYIFDKMTEWFLDEDIVTHGLSLTSANDGITVKVPYIFTEKSRSVKVLINAAKTFTNNYYSKLFAEMTKQIGGDIVTNPNSLPEQPKLDFKINNSLTKKIAVDRMDVVNFIDSHESVIGLTIKDKFATALISTTTNEYIVVHNYMKKSKSVSALLEKFVKTNFVNDYAF